MENMHTDVRVQRVNNASRILGHDLIMCVHFLNPVNVLEFSPSVARCTKFYFFT